VVEQLFGFEFWPAKLSCCERICGDSKPYLYQGRIRNGHLTLFGIFKPKKFSFNFLGTRIRSAHAPSEIGMGLLFSNSSSVFGRPRSFGESNPGGSDGKPGTMKARRNVICRRSFSPEELTRIDFTKNRSWIVTDEGVVGQASALSDPASAEKRGSAHTVFERLNLFPGSGVGASVNRKSISRLQPDGVDTRGTSAARGVNPLGPIPELVRRGQTSGLGARTQRAPSDFNWEPTVQSIPKFKASWLRAKLNLAPPESSTPVDNVRSFSQVGVGLGIQP